MAINRSIQAYVLPVSNCPIQTSVVLVMSPAFSLVRTNGTLRAYNQEKRKTIIKCRIIVISNHRTTREIENQE